jgi:hypothetical protein
VRSARSTDVPLLTPLREPLFAWSGANSAFAALIRSVAIRDVGFEVAPDAYVRADDRSGSPTAQRLFATTGTAGQPAGNEHRTRPRTSTSMAPSSHPRTSSSSSSHT